MFLSILSLAIVLRGVLGEFNSTCVDHSKIDPDIVCIMEHKPVCGCNGVSYGNECLAQREGVLLWRIDYCDEKQCIDETLIDPNIRCDDRHEPVCGCNNRNYPNSCFAEREGVTYWRDGSCGRMQCIDSAGVDSSVVCHTRHQPVCGCDGKDYTNSCFAQRYGIRWWSEGTCNV
jgi:hypothetical protein